MEEQEKLKAIQNMIERISKEKDSDRCLLVLKDFVSFRIEHHPNYVRNIDDIYYFLCGILFEKGISDYWNGREKK